MSLMYSKIIPLWTFFNTEKKTIFVKHNTIDTKITLNAIGDFYSCVSTNRGIQLMNELKTYVNSKNIISVM